MSVSAKREARVELRSAFDGRGVDDADRKLRSFARDQARAARQAEREAKRARKETLSTGRNLASGVVSGIGMAVGLQGMSGLADMAHDVLSYEKALTRLQITASASPESMREFSKTVGEASLSTGINRNEILSAAAAYVGLTGDFELPNLRGVEEVAINAEVVEGRARPLYVHSSEAQVSGNAS